MQMTNNMNKSQKKKAEKQNPFTAKTRCMLIVSSYSPSKNSDFSDLPESNRLSWTFHLCTFSIPTTRILILLHHILMTTCHRKPHQTRKFQNLLIFGCKMPDDSYRWSFISAPWGKRYKQEFTNRAWFLKPPAIFGKLSLLWYAEC